MGGGLTCPNASWTPSRAMSLDKDRSKALAALTFAVAEKCAGDARRPSTRTALLRKWRMWRAGSRLLIDQPADETAPRCINVYAVDAEDIDASSGLAEHGQRFKFDPSRVVVRRELETSSLTARHRFGGGAIVSTRAVALVQSRP